MKDIIDEIQSDLENAKKAYNRGDEEKAKRFLRKAHNEMESEFGKLPWGVKEEPNKKRVVREKVVLPEALLQDLIDAGDEVQGTLKEACGDGKFSGKWKKLKNTLAKYPKRTGSMYKKNLFKETRDQYEYQLLGRLEQDCKYFLGNGNGHEKHLWAGNVEDQISKMKNLYKKLKEKPEWLSMRDIKDYEKRMLRVKNS